MASLTELLSRWREDLAAWAIPDSITAGVAESPWVLPRQVFARRADRLRRAPGGPSYERAREALAPAGSVLDIGSGAGAACLPLAPCIPPLTPVDTDEPILRLLAARAGRAGLEPQVMPGRWPDIAAPVPPADGGTGHHVPFTVPELWPFLAAVSGHARRPAFIAHPPLPGGRRPIMGSFPLLAGGSPDSREAGGEAGAYGNWSGPG